MRLGWRLGDDITSFVSIHQPLGGNRRVAGPDGHLDLDLDLDHDGPDGHLDHDGATDHVGGTDPDRRQDLPAS
jgi:hypothetical protein